MPRKQSAKPKPKRKTERQKRLEREAAKVRVPRRKRPNGAGRPTLYNPTVLAAAKTMAEKGANKSEIAVHLGISYQTLRNWELTKPDFFEAINGDEVVLTKNVARSVYERATGYEYAAEKVFQYRGEIIRAPVIEHCPPDIAAAKFWLTNKAPDEWQERSSQSVEHKLSFSEAFEQYLSQVHSAPAVALEVEAAPVKGEGDD